MLENEEIRVLAGYQADGEGTITSAVCDTAGYDSVTYIVFVGTVTGSGTVSAQVWQDTALAMNVDLDAATGAVAALVGSAASDTVLAIEVYRPVDRWQEIIITRGVANSIVLGILAILRDPTTLPVVQGAAVSDSTFVASPADA
ncbi:MAG: hypothetical protein NTZ17_17835 [Phycisphaerae bacterium]|nr:hypothetical protein [Phycisphaerae bacterium]